MCPCWLHRKQRPSLRCLPLSSVVVTHALVLPISMAFGFRLSTFLHCVCVCPWFLGPPLSLSCSCMYSSWWSCAEFAQSFQSRGWSNFTQLIISLGGRPSANILSVTFSSSVYPAFRARFWNVEM